MNYTLVARSEEHPARGVCRAACATASRQPSGHVWTRGSLVLRRAAPVAPCTRTATAWTCIIAFTRSIQEVLGPTLQPGQVVVPDTLRVHLLKRCSKPGSHRYPPPPQPPRFSVPLDRASARQRSRPGVRPPRSRAHVTGVPHGHSSLRPVRCSRPLSSVRARAAPPNPQSGRAARGRCRESARRPRHKPRGRAHPARWADAARPVAGPVPPA
jgi:hypothetical protein